MSDDIWANPGDLKRNGVGYQALSDGLTSVIATVTTLMSSLEGDQAWGDDDAGQMFAATYQPSSAMLHLSVNQLRDGFQYTADGVKLMADTFEDGEENNHQIATDLSNSIVSHATTGNGGDGQSTEQRAFVRSRRPAEGGNGYVLADGVVQPPGEVEAPVVMDRGVLRRGQLVEGKLRPAEVSQVRRVRDEPELQGRQLVEGKLLPAEVVQVRRVRDEAELRGREIVEGQRLPAEWQAQRWLPDAASPGVLPHEEPER